jgi:acyl dehydratase
VTAETLEPRSFGPITVTDIVRYQGASGDFNPIHHDEAFARASGAPSVFSVGMLQAGFLAAYCADLYGPESVRRFRVRFHDRVWPGDTLTCEGEVLAEHPDETSITLRLRSGSTLVASGEATVVPVAPPS